MDWASGRDEKWVYAQELRAIRNNLGPTWLMSLPKEEIKRIFLIRREDHGVDSNLIGVFECYFEHNGFSQTDIIMIRHLGYGEMYRTQQEDKVFLITPDDRRKR